MEHDEKVKIENHNTMTNCNVFTGPVYGGTFPLPGSQTVVNNYYGNPNNPQKRDETTEAESIAKEEKSQDALNDEKKRAIISSITTRFDFEPSQLAADRKSKRLSNERLGLLFSKIFGVSSNPSHEKRKVIDELWKLLTERKKTNGKRDASDGFYWQTVLNIIGYFREKKLLNGSQLELAKAVFPEADANVAKNIERSIHNGYTFPEGTATMIDWYIEELLNGNF